MESPRILLLTSEVAPFAKTGGLGDVAAALGRTLTARGHEIVLALPMYPRVREALPEATPVSGLQDVPIRVGPHTYWVSLSQARLPGSDCRLALVRCPALFERPDIYTQDPDEPLRFQVHALAALESCVRTGWSPDVVHLNDWQGGLVPLTLRTRYADEPVFRGVRTLLTIHNLGYQGVFGADVVDDLGLREHRGLLFQEDLKSGHVNFLKSGILYADWLSTVSETYAREIQGETLGMGLEELLQRRNGQLTGIVNGVEYEHWDPAHDPHLPHPYTAADLAGKARNKAALREEVGLPGAADAPLLGVVARLTWQKGLELVAASMPGLCAETDASLVVLGSGEARYEKMFQELAAAHPGRVAFLNRYDDALAHRIEAGADLFLMPSRYEPCGLNQMYSLRYGTAPVVRRTGGLADTVQEFDPAAGTGTGFLFDEFDAATLGATLRHALEVYRRPADWRRLVQNAMAMDWSWEHQVGHYERLYRGLAEGARAHGG